MRGLHFYVKPDRLRYHAFINEIFPYKGVKNSEVEINPRNVFFVLFL